MAQRKLHDPQAEPTPASVQSRRQGIRFLNGLTLAFFMAAWGLTFLQAARAGHGIGLGDGTIVGSRRVPVGGTGAIGDAVRLCGAIALDLALIAVWTWIARRVGDDRDVGHVGGDVSSSWYQLDIPRTTGVLTAVAFACVVAIVMTSFFLFPLILLRYGWS
jgi:hypothetical protein